MAGKNGVPVRPALTGMRSFSGDRRCASMYFWGILPRVEKQKHRSSRRESTFWVALDQSADALRLFPGTDIEHSRYVALGSPC